MAQLQAASTTTWGWERWGKCIDTVAVQADNDSGRDMASSCGDKVCKTAIIAKRDLSRHSFLTCAPREAKYLPLKARRGEGLFLSLL
jgi:hypothetical protein